MRCFRGIGQTLGRGSSFPRQPCSQESLHLLLHLQDMQFSHCLLRNHFITKVYSSSPKSAQLVILTFCSSVSQFRGAQWDRHRGKVLVQAVLLKKMRSKYWLYQTSGERIHESHTSLCMRNYVNLWRNINLKTCEESD